MPRATWDGIEAFALEPLLSARGVLPLAGFLALGAPFCWVAVFFEEAAVASALVMAVITSFLGPIRRMTIDHSSGPERQRKKVAAPARIR
jgi:hypothetical protein